MYGDLYNIKTYTIVKTKFTEKDLINLCRNNFMQNQFRITQTYDGTHRKCNTCDKIFSGHTTVIFNHLNKKFYHILCFSDVLNYNYNFLDEIFSPLELLHLINNAKKKKFFDKTIFVEKNNHLSSRYFCYHCKKSKKTHYFICDNIYYCNGCFINKSYLPKQFLLLNNFHFNPNLNKNSILKQIPRKYKMRQGGYKKNNDISSTQKNIIIDYISIYLNSNYPKYPRPSNILAQKHSHMYDVSYASYFEKKKSNNENFNECNKCKLLIQDNFYIEEMLNSEKKKYHYNCLTQINLLFTKNMFLLNIDELKLFLNKVHNIYVKFFSSYKINEKIIYMNSLELNNLLYIKFGVRNYNLPDSKNLSYLKNLMKNDYYVKLCFEKYETHTFLEKFIKLEYEYKHNKLIPKDLIKIFLNFLGYGNLQCIN